MRERRLGGGSIALLAVVVCAGASCATAAVETPDPPPAPVASAEAADQTTSAASTAVPADGPPCGAPEFRQLDFWVGEWELTWEGGHGTNSVTRELGDCVIEERFSGDMGENGIFDGRSVSTFDRQTGEWKQTWVDNQGGYLDFTGGPDGDRFVFVRDGVRDGRPVRQRMVFYNIEDDSLDWNWEQSTEGGPWELRWKIHYRRSE